MATISTHPVPRAGCYSGQVRRLALVVPGLVAVATACGARTSLDGGELTTTVGPSVPCIAGTFELQRARPTLMFVIDRSRSMLTSFGSTGMNRHQVLREALAVALPPLDASLEIGALLFPTPGGTSSGYCGVVGEPELKPAAHQVEALLALMTAHPPPGGATPTAEAVRAAASALGGLRAAGTARALVLATDGAPDCNDELEPATCTCVGQGGSCQPTRCLDDARTVLRIAEAAAAGVPTYVVGLQNGDGGSLAAVLDAMADAGQRPLVNQPHRYYAASSAAELDAAFVAIRDQVGSCTYLTRSVPDPAGTIRLRVDGRELVADPTRADGWTWADRENGEIILAAASCQAVQAGAHVIAELACGSSTPRP